MTVKTFSTKSNAKRALTKAILGIEAFVFATEVESTDEGYTCIVDVLPGAGKEVVDHLIGRGMDANLLTSEPEDEAAAPVAPVAPVLTEGEAAAVARLGIAPLTDSEEGGHAQTAFAQAFRAAGGWEKRGLCRALRTVAASWTGKHKEFVDSAKALGLNGNNASAEYYAARKGR